MFKIISTCRTGAGNVEEEMTTIYIKINDSREKGVGVINLSVGCVLPRDVSVLTKVNGIGGIPFYKWNTDQQAPKRQNHVAASPQHSGRQGAAFGPPGPHAKQQLNGAAKHATGTGPNFWIMHKHPSVGDGFTIL